MAEKTSRQHKAVAKLGVGLNYQPQFLPFLESHFDEFDFLEIVPDIFWIDQGKHSSPRYIEDAVQVEFLKRIRGFMPVIMHSIGLSIGSAHNFDPEQLDQLAKWQQWLGSPWHSDHLAFHLTDASLAEVHGFAHGAETNTGVTLPVRRNKETLRRLASRVGTVRQTIGVPFLLENNVYFTEMPGDEMEEAEFLNAMCREAGCGLLLDLHNVYCNSLNMGVSAWKLLERLDLSNVIEIHLGGGHEDGSYYLDSHSGPTPEPVWEMLDYVLPRTRNLAGIVFELFGSWYSTMGESGLSAELVRIKQAWRRGQAAPRRQERIPA